MNSSYLFKFLLRYPILIAFVISIAVANIWKLVQSADAIDNSIANESIVQTTAATENVTTDITTFSPVATTPPAPMFQTVDASYFDDALFIGDSRTEGLALYGSLTNADFFSNVGLSIYQVTEKQAGNPNTSESVTLDQKLASKQYGKVYIMLGLNELGTGTTESWAETYAQVVAKIRQAQPNATIYIESILLVSAAQDDPSGAINNATVRSRNEALAAMENTADRIYYLNVNEAVMDASGCLDASLTNDGIHLIGTALPVWEDYLKQHAVLDTTGAGAVTTPVPVFETTATEAVS